MSVQVKTISGWIQVAGNSEGGGGGVSTYAELPDKPQINYVELNGNKTLHDLGIQAECSRANPLDDSYILHDHDYLDTKINSMDSDISTLQTDVQGNKTNISGLNTKVDSLENYIADYIDKDIEELKRTVGQANDLLEGVLYGNS